MQAAREHWDFKNVTGFNITFWLLQTFDVNGFLNCMKSRRMCHALVDWPAHRPWISFYSLFPISQSLTVEHFMPISLFCRLSLFSAAATSFSVCIVNSISKKTSKSAQHLLHLMRLMTIIDRSSNSTQPQSLQSQKHQPIHFDWLVRAHQHFYDGRFNEARPHISTIESLLTVYANYFYCYS